MEITNKKTALLSELALSNQVRKRFCQDFKLPINILSEPYFDYFVELYDSHYHVKEKLGWLQTVLKDCMTQEDFFGMSEGLSKKIREKISGSEAYKKFNEADLQKDFARKEIIAQQNIYISTNIGKPLISVDLDSANFNCFRLFGLQDEIKAHSYAELVSQFTSYDYFRNSKHIRQIIFGDLNPARQQKLQKYIINTFCTKLLKEGCTLSSASSDEIIISNDISVQTVKDILSDVPETYKFFRVEPFVFERVAEREEIAEKKVGDFFIKKTFKSSGEQKLEFKGVPGHLHAQVFKRYYGMAPHDNDLLFHHEGFLAQFKETLFKPVTAKKPKI